MRGFMHHAGAALQGNTLNAEQHEFLKEGFDGARERMTNLASTIGTAGSFVLVLVALLVGFANSVNEESDKLVAASQAATLAAQGCSDDAAASATCSQAKLQQALDNVGRAEQRVSDLTGLNEYQAAAGGFVMLGFLLGLAGLLTNPVVGPHASRKDQAGVTAWKNAVDRLGAKRNWIITSLVAQLSAIMAITLLGLEVF